MIFGLSAVAAFADSFSVNFETPDYSVGSINGQDGWSSTGSYDQGVVSSPVISGSQSFRISNAVVSGSFGDQTFSKSLTNEAGETSAVSDGYSGGTRQNHFEAQFDLASTVPGLQQPNLYMSVSPDRGDGARMSYLRFEDQSDDVHVFFDDYKDVSPFGTTVGDANGCGTGDDFTDSDIATLDRSVKHTVKFVMDFVDGPRNDVVKIYIDGVLKTTGTSWEDYFRYCEGNPTRPVDSLLFRVGGTQGIDNAGVTPGNGFLIDNLSESSSTPVAACPVGTVQSSTKLETVPVNSALNTPTSSVANLTSGKNYLLVSSGTWTNSLNVADTEYASTDNWATHMNGYDINPYFLGEGEFDLKVDGAFLNWGAYDSSTHTYSHLYTGNGNSTNFLVFDGDSNTNTIHPEWYGDNTGSLSVDIYSCDVVKVGPPTDANQCKKDGWKTFNNPTFKNQGQCVSYVQANEHAGKR